MKRTGLNQIAGMTLQALVPYAVMLIICSLVVYACAGLPLLHFELLPIPDLRDRRYPNALHRHVSCAQALPVVKHEVEHAFGK